jgi:hypothetical protein
MKFCSNCGAPIEGNERFCVKCGTPISANGAAIPVTAPLPLAAVTYAAPPPPMPPQPVAAVPVAYPPQIPVAMPMPPQAPAQSGNKMWTWIVVAALAAGGYYYYTHKAPAAPATPPVAPAPAVPTPGAGANAALAKLQVFNAHWQTVSGFVQISNGVWTNNATVPIQSSTLECDQYDANNNNLDQMTTTLNGPVQPAANVTFNPFNMGAAAANMTHVTCTITHVVQVAAAP